MNFTMVKPLIIFLLLLYSDFLYGQEEEFNISIADKTEETGLLEKGQWQLEGGFLYNGYKKGAASEIEQFFIRYGLSKSIEVRVMTEEGNGRDRYIEETVQSTYPLSAGVKVKLLEDHAVLPDMTLVGYVHLPFTAHTKMQTLYWSPMIFMAFQHKLSDKWSIDYNAGAQQESYGTSWSGLFNGSVHYKFTKDLETFIEYFAQYEPLVLPQHNAGAGLTYSIGKHIALYLSGGHTIFYADYNYFLSAGAALKF